MTRDYRAPLRAAEIAATGKRFCTACQSQQDAATGQMTGSRGKRWICAACLLRREKREKFSIYSR